MNFSERTGELIYPCTIGTLKVVRSYSENYLAGDEIPFARMDGILSFDQYLEGMTESQRDKLLYLSQEASRPEYVQIKVNGDIVPETGKTYFIGLSEKNDSDAFVNRMILGDGKDPWAKRTFRGHRSLLCIT